MTEDFKVYIIVYPDNRMELYPLRHEKKCFMEGASCYSCPDTTDIDTIREFVYTAGGCNMEHGYFREVFTKEW